MKYCTVLSKPNTGASQAAGAAKESTVTGKDLFEEMGVSPRFYHVRRYPVPGEKDKREEGGTEGEGEGETEIDAEIDEQVS